jgi:HPt (histidine-containing phosphotransfer) domain-containing protein
MKMIDQARIDELIAEIGKEDFAEVAEMFLDEADEVIARIMPGDTATQLEKNLHFLKGSALNLGLKDLAEICQRGERQAMGGDNDFPIDDVHAIYAASRESFAAQLAQLTLN